MNEKQHFLHKLYIVIVLCITISLGLVYLLFTDRNEVHIAKPAIKEPASNQFSSFEEKKEEPVYDTTSNDSLYRIANYDHTIDSSYVPADLVDAGVNCKEGSRIRACMKDDLENMFAAAIEDGVELYLVSGYRSYEEQEKLYDYYVKEYGEAVAHTMDAYPGVSEHMLGLSVDLGKADHEFELEDEFAGTDAYNWLMEHAKEYGFILRYPKNSEAVNGIAFSPWSFRYVGKEMAVKIMESGKTMEEYFYGTDGTE